MPRPARRSGVVRSACSRWATRSWTTAACFWLIVAGASPLSAIGDEPPNGTLLLEPDDRVTLAAHRRRTLLIDDADGRPWMLAGWRAPATSPSDRSAGQRLATPATSGRSAGNSVPARGRCTVAACSDGLVHRLMADGSAGVNEQPFVWFVGERPRTHGDQPHAHGARNGTHLRRTKRTAAAIPGARFRRSMGRAE